MKKWEYVTVVTGVLLQSELNEYGYDRWELINVINSKNCTTYLFKRILEEKEELLDIVD